MDFPRARELRLQKVVVRRKEEPQNFIFNFFFVISFKLYKVPKKLLIFKAEEKFGELIHTR